MIEFVTGNLLNADVDALVNTVNCVGVMGRGVALQFKKSYPENFARYEAACERGEIRPGAMFVTSVGIFPPRLIINFPTKRHWKGKSRLADIQSGLIALVAEIQSREITSIALPPLGCGLGGLEWDVVRPLIVKAFEALPGVRVVVYEPAGAPASVEMARTAVTPKMTVGRAALVGLMSRYLGAVMDPFVTLLEIHKLMYFMQEAGESLQLKFVKALYGPYSENLRHVLNHIEGHFITGYGDAGDDPEKPLDVTRDASSQAGAFLEAHPDTRTRFERVVRLIEGFATPYGMELLATVHWVARGESVRTADAAVIAVHSWNKRKSEMFSEKHIRLAWKELEERGWLPATTGPTAAT